LIAFLGSVFTYFKRSGRASPLDHAALNVVLYGPKARWTMTERPQHVVRPEASQLGIGPSSVRWVGDCLVIDIEEHDKRIGVPWQRTALQGRSASGPRCSMINRSRSTPPATICGTASARVRGSRLRCANRALRWKGSAYLDSNRGNELLEKAFVSGIGPGAHLGRDVAVFYEGAAAMAPPSPVRCALMPLGSRMKRSCRRSRLYRIPIGNERRTRADRGFATVRRTWEDVPFYTRSTVHARIYGEKVVATQGLLSLDRFCSPIVQIMLPFRMPRARRRIGRWFCRSLLCRLVARNLTVDRDQLPKAKSQSDSGENDDLNPPEVLSHGRLPLAR